MRKKVKQKSGHFLFHFLLNLLRQKALKKKCLVVGVSGGVDSMVLLSLLLELKSVFNWQLYVVHVNHGTLSKKQRMFQEKAQKLVGSVCDKKGVEFYSSKVLSQEFVKKHLMTEEGMRKYRYRVFNSYLKKLKANYLVLAHTESDLLETRILRLIRGTGKQGLSAMFVKGKNILRPLLQISRTQIEAYAKKQNITWCEDPSNSNPKVSLRNWIRLKWLPDLEKRHSGATQSLARSLHLIVQKVENKQLEDWFYQYIAYQSNTFQRKALLTLPLIYQQSVLAGIFRQSGFLHYQQTHVLELIKRLKNKRKKFTFSLLGKTWTVSNNIVSFPSPPKKEM